MLVEGDHNLAAQDGDSVERRWNRGAESAFEPGYPRADAGGRLRLSESIPRTEITGLILAGGRGRRMGGRDKGLLPLGGRRLIEQVVAQLKPQVGALLINANRHLDAYSTLGYPVVADSGDDDYMGPLAGFLAGVRALRTPYLLTVPCDGPRLSTDFAQRLARAMLLTGADVAVAASGQRLQPVYTLMSRSIERSLQAALQDDRRKVEDWIRANRWIAVDFRDSPQQFTNINTLDDLRLYRSQVR